MDTTDSDLTDHSFIDEFPEYFTTFQRLLFAALPTSESLINKITSLEEQSILTQWIHEQLLTSELSKEYLDWQFVSPAFTAKFTMLLQNSLVSLDDLEQHLSQETFENVLIIRNTPNILAFLKKCSDNPLSSSAHILLTRFDQALQKHKAIWAPYVDEIQAIKNHVRKIRTERISRYSTMLSRKQHIDTRFSFA
jgi:hypothetical protein